MSENINRTFTVLIQIRSFCFWPTFTIGEVSFNPSTRVATLGSTILDYYNMNNTIFLISSYINSVSRSRLVTLLLFSRPLDPFFLQKHLKILICIYRINLIICKLLLFDIKLKNYYYHFSHLALSASAEKVLKDANKFLTRTVLYFYGEFFTH